MLTWGIARIGNPMIRFNAFTETELASGFHLHDTTPEILSVFHSVISGIDKCRYFHMISAIIGNMAITFAMLQGIPEPKSKLFIDA